DVLGDASLPHGAGDAPQPHVMLLGVAASEHYRRLPEQDDHRNQLVPNFIEARVKTITAIPESLESLERRSLGSRASDSGY
ncbi:MAG: hypothetical protein ACJ8EJ_14200, partial [Xanthobacteraceae bacterium]